MTLTLELPPEVEARLGTEAEQQGLTLTEYALQKLLSSPYASKNMAHEETAGESILRIAAETFGSLPEAERMKLPPDYATNYKHYLHGAPKVEE